MSETADAASPHQPAAAAERRLDPRYIPLQRVAGAMTTAFLAGASLVGLSAVLLSARLPSIVRLGLLLAWMAGVLAFAAFSYVWPVREYLHTSYTVDWHGIEIRRGVFWREVVNVPRSRVQHTDVAQGPFERRFGLGTLVIYTAGTEHARVALPGLEHGDALRIRDHLLPREGADAV